MNGIQIEQLKYPIGIFSKPEVITKQHIKGWIADIENFPNALEAIIKNLTEEEFNYTYRPNGWSIKQVVHHCADSHINSIIRFKLALTEDSPTIKPYFEDKWAKLIDYSEPVDSSIQILKGVHHKLGVLLKSLNENDLKKEFIHPEHGKQFSIQETIGTYAWHSNHHLAHIKQALKHKGIF
ncbi:DinB family protein [Winogradskyella wandonensis]|uniref:DinB family protein n=1 Tax=Winogradskyella wandonensis TaxID=1442586 RepID=A0A4V2PU09_9FLAO|nr:putative metal-dependent hydrolase [Winogradskyella wandonensis]TCK68621.1 DinB family protein [Winogradskyella wandonensis]